MKNKNVILKYLLWVLQGIIVGFGAILPGVSGGTLCVAFGMYRPIIEVLSDLKSGLKKHFLMLFTFFLGVGIGFVGLSGVTNFLLEKNAPIVTAVFVGFIIGTVPELWSDAVCRGKSKAAYVGAAVAFLGMIGILYLISSTSALNMGEGIGAFAFCGVLWGLSFIVPGLSSSALLIFFGLYQPMLDGISKLRLSVILPMGIAMAVCVLLLSKAVGFLFERYYTVASFAVLGIVGANIVMIFPDLTVLDLPGVIITVLGMIAAAVASYFFTVLCARIRKKADTQSSELSE